MTLLLAMRLIPIIPFSLFSIVAGAARVPLPTFLWTTVVGYLPLTALFVYLGSQLEEPLADRPGHLDRRRRAAGDAAAHPPRPRPHTRMPDSS